MEQRNTYSWFRLSKQSMYADFVSSAMKVTGHLERLGGGHICVNLCRKNTQEVSTDSSRDTDLPEASNHKRMNMWPIE